MPAPVTPTEGWGVLHLFFTIDRQAAQGLPPGAAKDLVATLERLQADDDAQVHLFSVLGHKADLLVFALAEDLGTLRRLQTAIQACAAGPALSLDYSYVSLTESSEYTATPEQYREEMAAKGVSGDDLERRVDEFAQRMADYRQHKLYPQMPPWETVCFYPMSHRREGDDNWYALDFDERKRLMHEHGRSGRAFTGRVLQLVSGSTGIDDWEWGVTLFAHDVDDLKEIVYTMRYDEASVRYAEFGPFVTGLRRSPEELVVELGLLDGA